MDNDYFCFESLPHFQIDLKDPPQKRWKPILDVYADKIRLTYKTLLDTMVPISARSWILPLVYRAIEKMAKKGKVLHVEELQSIAQATKIPFGGVCLMQIAYELAAGCTSAVSHGRHYRTMDWPMSFLVDLTISVEFVYGGKNYPVYRGITWAGMIGILTAVKRGVGSVSLNYRRQNKSILTNLVRLWKGYWPSSYLIRHAMEQSMNYTQLQDQLARLPLVAPAYFTLCAPSKVIDRTSCILIRNRESLAKCINHDDKQKEEKGGMSLVQTNCDNPNQCRPEEDIMSSVRRAHIAQQILSSKEISLQEFLVPPILNSITLYACKMNPNNGEMESVRIRKKGG